MAVDYNDPAVAEEFMKVQPMTYEEVEDELILSGVRGNPSMNEMDLKLMLVEVRLRMSGRLPGQSSSAKKTKPAKFSSKFEEAIWTKPAFEELYNEYKKKGDHNSQNVMAEYMNNRDVAIQRYGKDYRGLIKAIEASLTAVAPVKTPTVRFSGFPANMGEMGCKMTLEALGPVVEFECSESEDFPILTGKVTFEDIETAKKAIQQYNGMNMGMGQVLEVTPV